MKKFNRLLSLILVLSLALSCMIMTPVSASTAIPSDSILDVLTDLKFYDPEAEIDFSAPVSRAEFAKVAAKLVFMGNIENIVSDPIPYVDVDESESVYPSVSLLYKTGFVKGTDATHFEPYTSITPEQALTILIRIMGYDYVAKNTGSYFVAAQNKGLLKKVTFDSETEITYSDLYTLVYNVLKADISDFNEIDGNPDTDGKELFIEKRHNIFRVEGLVSDIGKSSIYGESQIPKSSIKIDDLVVRATDDMKDGLLGKYIEGFYAENDDGEYELVAAGVLENRNNVVTMNAQYILEYSDNTYKYYIEGTDEDNYLEETVSDSYLLIYNGKAFKSTDTFTPDLLTPSIGTVTLIDNDGDNVFDIINVYDYKTFIVGSVNTTDEVIYSYQDVLMPKLELGLNNVTYEILNKNKDTVKFSDLKELNVLLVASSLDNKNHEILLSTETVSGTVTALGGNIVEIDGGEYKTKYPVVNGNTMSFNLTPGIATTFYIDSFGNIAFVKASATDDTSTFIGYVYGIGLDGKGMDKPLKLKIFTSRGAYATFTASKKVKVDGVNYTSADYDAMWTAIAGQDSNGNRRTEDFLIRFRINDDMEIIWVDTEATVNEDESLELIPTEESARYYTRNYGFNGDIGVSLSSVIFQLPVPFEEENAKVVTRAGLVDNVLHDIKAYNIGDKISISADVFVLKSATTTFTLGGDGSSFGVITGVSRVYDAEEDEETLKLSISNDGQSPIDVYVGKATDIEFTVVGQPTQTLDVGDIINYKLDLNKKLVAGNFSLLYDYSRDELKSTTSSISQWRSNFRVARDYVYNYQDGLLQTTQVDPTLIPGKTQSELNLKIYGATSARVAKFKPSTGKITTMTVNDLGTYLNVTDSCDRIFYRSYYGTIISIFVYDI